MDRLIRHFSSRDGTAIAVWSGGHGPPLLLVHGATADHSTTWRLVLATLEQSFTVHAMDRRGRGGSGDTTEYSLAIEAADVSAVIEGIGGEIDVVGHSYGALCALEATLLSPAIHRLVLYEGVPLDGSGLYDPAWLQRLEEQLASGDREGALVSVYLDLVGLPQYEIELLRSQTDAWEARLASVETLPREVRAERDYRFAPDRFANVAAPTLLLVGENSPSIELKNAEAVASALCDARVGVLLGQGHTAMHSAPGLFASAVLGHLLE